MPLFYNGHNNTRWYFIKESLQNKKSIPDADIVFLGESRVNAGIDFIQISNSYSFAAGGSTSIEMYYVLNKYLQIHKNPEKVFISISPRFLCEIFGFYEYSVRNNFFSFSEMNEIVKSYKKNNHDKILGKFPVLKFLLYKADYLEYYQKDVLTNNVFGAYNKNKLLIEQMKKMNGARPHPGLKDSCSDLNYETKYKNFEPSPILDFYLNNIFNICKEKDIQVVFEFMPVNKSSYSKFNKKFVSEYQEYILKYKREYPDFLISDSVYFYEDNYFGDESHLNSKGKAKYTQYIKTKFNI